MKHMLLSVLALFGFAIMAPAVHAEGLACSEAGPQTPRDISLKVGENMTDFSWAPAYSEMNLCNIHTHTNAENKGPDFSVFKGDGVNGGYGCNAAESLTEAQLTDPTGGTGAYKDVKPGDTIEVHWVHSTCDVAPGEGLGACLSEGCENPSFRVEAQVFLLVNDENALNFNDFVEAEKAEGAAFHQAKAIPSDTGAPVLFRGSTTGPSYDDKVCSPLQVTWSVRPQCAMLNIASLHAWAESGNVFKETKSHGVRQLVTNPKLLSPIE